jgi:RNA polymerase sigma-70 factor (ECF subfamily)
MGLALVKEIDTEFGGRADPIDQAEQASLVDRMVRKAQGGDPDAFEGVYRANVGRIHALCLRMSSDAQHAETLTQDVFVRAWQKLSSFRGESQFSTWLHRLAINVILQDRRSRGRRQAREHSVENLEHYATATTQSMPGTKVDLERAIAGLPDGAKQVLVLRDVQGFKYKEIAEMTGVTLGTVKAQIHRARALVQEALER